MKLGAGLLKSGKAFGLHGVFFKAGSLWAGTRQKGREDCGDRGHWISRESLQVGELLTLWVAGIAFGEQGWVFWVGYWDTIMRRGGWLKRVSEGTLRNSRKSAGEGSLSGDLVASVTFCPDGRLCPSSDWDMKTNRGEGREGMVAD